MIASRISVLEHVSSTWDWEISYQFAPHIDVYKDGFNIICSKDGKKINISVPLDFEIELRNGLRTFGRGNKIDAKTMVVKGNPGTYELELIISEDSD
jgi:hypothetical protein